MNPARGRPWSCNARAISGDASTGEGCRPVALCPELQLIGYPPEDLVLKPEFGRRAHEWTDVLVQATVEPGPALLIGTIVSEEGATFNALVLASNGVEINPADPLKHELPNYGTFRREADLHTGPASRPLLFKGAKIGVPICENIWQDIVCTHLADRGADLLLVPNSQSIQLLTRTTPLSAGPAHDARERDFQSPHLNRVGGQDELVIRRFILRCSPRRRTRRSAM